jgi:hypothetical protein
MKEKLYGTILWNNKEKLVYVQGMRRRKDRQTSISGRQTDAKGMPPADVLAQSTKEPCKRAVQ